MKTNVVKRNSDGTVNISEDVFESLELNGTYLPDVARVVYSLKTTEKVPVKNKDGSIKTEPVFDEVGEQVKDRSGKPVRRNVYVENRIANPILVTRVWWADNTTTTVRNSEHDKVETTMVKLPDGSEVEVADRCSKERGLLAAVVKRTCGVPDGKGEMTETNLGKILGEIIDSAYDQKYEEAKAKILKAESKKKYEEAKKKAKAKPKRYSYEENAQMLGKILETILNNPKAMEKLAGFLADEEKPVKPATKKAKKA